MNNELALYRKLEVEGEGVDHVTFNQTIKTLRSYMKEWKEST